MTRPSNFGHGNDQDKATPSTQSSSKSLSAYWATDTNKLYVENSDGTAWVQLPAGSNGVNIDQAAIPLNGQTLVYNSAASNWEPSATALSISRDPEWPYVSMLLIADRGFQDESDFRHSVAANASVTIDTSIKKFGNSSYKFTGTNGIVVPYGNEFSASGTFTAEAWVYLESRADNQGIMGCWDNGGYASNDGWYVWVVNGQFAIRTSNGSGFADLATGVSPTVGQWYHVAAAGTGGTIDLYIDGVWKAQFSPGVNSAGSTFSVGTIGGTDTYPSSPTFDFVGHMDGIRITQGVRRYLPNTNFSVPTAQYYRALPADPLYHLDDLVDVDTSTLADGQALVYNAASKTWKPGTVSSGSSGSSALEVLDEGTPLDTAVVQINFTGAGVTATASGHDITVNIHGGGGGGGGDGGGSSRVLLSDQIISSTTAQVMFNEFDPTTYLNYEIEIDNLVVDGSTDGLAFTLSSDGGATFATGGSYDHAFSILGSGGYGSSNNANTATSALVCQGLGTTALQTGEAFIRLFNPASVTHYKQFIHDAVVGGGDGNMYQFHGASRWRSTAAYNAISLFGRSVNITSGRFRLYGIPIVAGGSGSPPGTRFKLPFFFTTTPVAYETLGMIVADEAFSIPANFAGAQNVVTGINPTSAFTITVERNGTAIGTIVISTAGVATLSTAGGSAVTVNVGDVITYNAPATVDATIANVVGMLWGNVL